MLKNPRKVVCQKLHHKRTTDGSDLGVIYPSNRACPYLRVCFHFVDHRSAKIYGNQKSPQNNKQHTVDFPFFFGGDFLIAIKKDTCTSVD